MRANRIVFASLVAVVAVVAVGLGLGLAGPSFARGGGGGAGGGASSTKTQPKKKTVLDMITEDTQLSKYAAALKAAGMEESLKGASSVTVLAPNDAAIGKVDAAKWGELNKPENKAKLKTLLEGMLIGSKMKVADIAKQTKITNKDGVALEVKKGEDGQPTIDGAKIVRSDVEASNGYVQIIDTVLMPPEKK